MVRLESQAATLAQRRPRSQTVRPHSLPSLLPATFISWWAELRKEEFASVPPTLASLSGGSRKSQPEGVLGTASTGPRLGAGGVWRGPGVWPPR